METIDLRSDTVTRPSEAMRDAMARAPVGDDVYGEDPSVSRLEERGAALVGKEAAVFVPSGTMANQVAVRSHCQPGDALIAGNHAHVYLYEGGGISALSGVQPALVGESGLFDAEDVRGAIHPRDDHYATTRLVCFENTHNRSGGRVFPLEAQHAIARVAREAGLALHLDGARLFNAAQASGHTTAELAAPSDSVSFCLSKGLGAPVGSLLCGNRAFIERARRFRKMLGGGMRQAGILAAAGLHALEHNVDRLADDHDNARSLASALASANGIALACEPETNIVLFDHPRAVQLVAELTRRGVLMSLMGPGLVRAVTHLDVSGAQISRAGEEIQAVCRALAA